MNDWSGFLDRRRQFQFRILMAEDMLKVNSWIIIIILPKRRFDRARSAIGQIRSSRPFPASAMPYGKVSISLVEVTANVHLQVDINSRLAKVINIRPRTSSEMSFLYTLSLQN